MDKHLTLLGAAHAHTPDHLRVVAEEGWRVTTVVDRDSERRARWAERLGATPLADVDDAAELGAAAAIVCSETVHHEADVTAALSRGLPCFSEKPLALDAHAADRLATTARRQGVVLDTAFFLRTNAVLAALRERVRSGALGRVLEARMRFAHDGAFASWLDLDGWMTDPARAGYGGFADEGVHALDWLVWTLGPVTDGTAMVAHTLGFAVDDHGAAAVRFEGDAIGTIEAGWTDSALRLEIELIGTAGWARVRDGRAELWCRGEGQPAWSATLPPLDAGEGVRPFLRSLAAGTPRTLVGADESAATSAVLDRLYRRG